MKHHVTKLVAAAAVLAGPAVAADLPSLPAGPKITVVAVTQPLPVQPQLLRVDVPVLKELVKEKSGGRIEFQLSTHAERNLGGSEIVRLVRSGQVDMGASTLTTLSGDVPFLDGIDLAGLAPEITTARKIAKAVIPAANKELEKFNSKILQIYPFPAQEIFCRAAMASFADLKGRKIRTFGNSLNDLVQAIGGQPVSIAYPEVYSALERGVVDCAITGTGSGNAAKWPEVTTHIYNLPVAWALSGYMVNLGWWNKLDPQVRTFIEKAMEVVEERQWALGAEATRDGIDCNIGNAAGCKIHNLVTNKPMTEVKPTAADQALLKEIFVKNVLPGWVKRCGARCGEIYNDVIAPISGIKWSS
jgi:TRAP-type C4-dicarboxylate transport system substrate-binding protein